MGVVSPIAALGVAVPVIAGFIGGETPSTLQAVGLVIALVGAVATSGPELSGGASARSVGLAAFAGVCFGTVFLAVDQGAKSSALMTLVGMRTTSIVMFGIAAIALRSIGGLDRTDLFPLFVIGFFDVAANLMYALASNRGYVSIVSVLASLYPVMTVLLARVGPARAAPGGPARRRRRDTLRRRLHLRRLSDPGGPSKPGRAHRRRDDSDRAVVSARAAE